MKIQDCSARQILSFWALGLTLESLLLAGPILQKRRCVEQLETRGATVDAQWRHTQDSVRMLSPAQQAEYRVRQNLLTKQARETVGRVMENVASPGLFAAIVGGGLFLLLVFAAIPLGLVILTTIWVRSRSRRPEPPSSVAA
jgi:hypothetical protein